MRRAIWRSTLVATHRGLAHGRRPSWRRRQARTRSGRERGVRVALQRPDVDRTGTAGRVPVGHASDRRDVDRLVRGQPGQGRRVGDIDTGIDLTNTDIMPNVDVAASCVFIYATTPTANPAEQVTPG